MPAKPFGEPVADQFGLMARGIVHDDVNVEIGGDMLFDGVEEAARPSSRLAANRLRQVATVTRVTPSCSAIARLVAPSAARSTISARDPNRRSPSHPRLLDRHRCGRKDVMVLRG